MIEKPLLTKHPAQAALVLIIACCVLIEGILSLADLGFLGSQSLRSRVYDYAGFWSGLLGSWRPNYTVQPYTMFLTYGFLHGGFLHLAVNMFTLWTAGNIVAERVGSRGLLIVYAASIIGGGLGYGLLAPTLTPMVGASGGLFGLVGSILAWSYIDRYSSNETLWPVVKAGLILIVLNIILWWAMNGHLAWETHLGGFVAGWIAALLVDPRPIDYET